MSVAAIPVNADPSPEKLVAVTTPTAFKPPARILAPTLAVRTPTESESVTLKNSYLSTIDISGWTLGDKNDTLAYNIPQETSLEVGEEITFNHTTLTFQINDFDENR